MMKLVEFSKAKLVRGLAPTFVALVAVFVLTLWPTYHAFSTGEVSRITAGGPIVLLISGAALAFWFTQVFGAARRGWAGVYVEDQRLHFFEWKYSSAAISDIRSIFVVQQGFFDRVAVELKSGSRRVILTNLMKGSAEDIAESVRRHVLGQRAET